MALLSPVFKVLLLSLVEAVNVKPPGKSIIKAAVTAAVPTAAVAVPGPVTYGPIKKLDDGTINMNLNNLRLETNSDDAFPGDNGDLGNGSSLVSDVNSDLNDVDSLDNGSLDLSKLKKIMKKSYLVKKDADKAAILDKKAWKALELKTLENMILHETDNC